MSDTKRQPESLEGRFFRNKRFAFLWFGFLIAVFLFVSWPIRNIALVCWVYGRRAYFYDGIRVLPGKPIRFSNGAEAPTLPDLVTGFGAFIITMGGLTLLLIAALRLYERHCRKL